MLRINDDTGYWTDFNTLRGVKMTYTLGTFIGLNFIDKLTLNDSFVRAFGLADITIDTIIGY
jgi:hypothetical protein